MNIQKYLKRVFTTIMRCEILILFGDLVEKTKGFKMKNVVGRKNLKMNDDVFMLRRRVMALIYEARELVADLPRVEVRIVENEGTILGTASLRVKHISIMRQTVEASDEYLRHVVFHELVHTLFGVRHIETCPLMKAIVDSPASKEQCHKLFKKYAKNSK